MRRTALRTILDATMGAAGMTYDPNATTDNRQLITIINMRMQEGWHWAPWPEWTPCEERAFADDWSATLTYAIDDVVWYATTEHYYKALAATTNVAPDSDATKWEVVLNVSDKLIAYAQLGKTRISRIYEVADRNLDNEDTYRAYAINLTSEGVRVMGSTLNTVWIKFQAPAPQFSAEPWSAAGDYDRYQVVFSPAATSGEMPEKGECYMVEQDVDGNYFWMLVQFPELLARFVVHTAAADLCRYYGKPDSADRLEAIGYDAIVNEARKLGLVAKFTVRVR